MRTLVLFLSLWLPLTGLGALVPGLALADPDSPVATLQVEAEKLRPWVRGPLAKRFLRATADLPTPEPRTVYYNKTTRQALTEAQAKDMPPEDLEGYGLKTLDAHFYYMTRYGSPLAFARVLDLLVGAGMDPNADLRIADFGFGSIGHLRLLASLGAQVTGIEVDPLLQAAYSDPGDVGTIPRGKLAGEGAPGTLQLLFGSYPAEAPLVEALGTGLTAFVSKNTLKNGYIHPAQEVDPRMLVDLGVEDRVFVQAVYDALAPGGHFLIYNLCPAQREEDYIPWADGTSPFTVELFKEVGFQVVHFDRDDTKAARELGELLGWGEQMDLATDLFGVYTLVRKPR